MSAPLPFRIDLKSLGLDDLGLLVRHPRSTAAVRRAFVRALDRWTKERIAMLTRSMTNVSEADRADIAQDFLLRCLTHHLRQWRPERTCISAYLFHRLRGAVIDAWRRNRRSARRDGGDEVDVVDHRYDVERAPHVRMFEACHAAAAAAIPQLPERQRLVVSQTLRGASQSDVAASLGVHPSTISRERSGALAALRAALEPFAEVMPDAFAAAA